MTSGFKAVTWLHRFHSVALVLLVTVGVRGAHTWPVRVAFIVAFIAVAACEAWLFFDARDYARLLRFREDHQ